MGTGLSCSNDQALQAGADLWVLPDLEQSEWARKIDWYLNFQLARASTHSTLKHSDELSAVVQKWEFDPPDVEVANQLPLMVASSDLLPNHSTVLLPLGGDVKSWTKRIFDLWRKLVRGIQAACQKRAVSLAQMEQIVDRVARWVLSRSEREIPARWVGEKVVKELRLLDNVAYVRFASVYRDFKDVQEFVTKLEEEPDFDNNLEVADQKSFLDTEV